MLQFPKYQLSEGNWMLPHEPLVKWMLQWFDPTTWCPDKDERIAKLQAIFGPASREAHPPVAGPSFGMVDSYSRTIEFAIRDVDALPAGVRMALCGTALDAATQGMPGTTAWGGWHYCRRESYEVKRCATQCDSCARNV